MSWFERLAQVGGKRCGKPSEQPQRSSGGTGRLRCVAGRTTQTARPRSGATVPVLLPEEAGGNVTPSRRATCTAT